MKSTFILLSMLASFSGFSSEGCRSMSVITEKGEDAVQVSFTKDKARFIEVCEVNNMYHIGKHRVLKCDSAQVLEFNSMKKDGEMDTKRYVVKTTDIKTFYSTLDRLSFNLIKSFADEGIEMEKCLLVKD